MALLLFLGGCLDDGPSRPQADAGGGGEADATDGGPYAWYPVQSGTRFILQTVPGPDSSIGGECCHWPIEAREAKGPFVARTPIAAVPAGTGANFHLTYSCEGPADARFAVQVLANGTEVGAGEAAETYVGSTIPVIADSVDIPFVLGAIPLGSQLSLEFSVEGCLAFQWGRGGTFPTFLAIDAPRDASNATAPNTTPSLPSQATPGL